MTLQLIALIITSWHSPSFADSAVCKDTVYQQSVSRELQEIYKEDQADRSFMTELKSGESPNPKKIKNLTSNDDRRRARVEELDRNGCLKSSADFEAAFMVMQHGNSAEHYLKALNFIQTAQRLSKKNLKSEIAMAVDRYLVSIGRKQLFGTQASMQGPGGCWCIQPIEGSVADSLRDEYRGGPNKPYTGLPYLDTLNKGKTCPSSYCDTKLAPPVRGSIPGVW